MMSEEERYQIVREKRRVGEAVGVVVDEKKRYAQFVSVAKRAFAFVRIRGGGNTRITAFAILV
jgi:hypothetical protein